MIKTQSRRFILLAWIFLGLIFQTSFAYAMPEIFFRTNDNQICSCDLENLSCHMDLESGPLAMKIKQPVKGEEDGETPQTAFKLDVNGRLFREYVLDFVKYKEVTFPTTADAENTLRICQYLGLPEAEKFICENVLKRGSKKKGLQESMPAPALAFSDGEDLSNKFIAIEGATFQMGSPIGERNRYDWETQHLVTLSAFEIGEAAVTQEIYAQVMGENPSGFKEEKYCKESYRNIEFNERKIPVCADHPVENVTWDDVMKFIVKLNEQDTAGFQYRLPTEAELEYSFRCGTTTAYVSGDTEAGLGDFVWYQGNSGGQTHPVKSKKANAFGIYRSSVWEWTSDLYGDYPAGAVTDPKGPDTGSCRVVRGGSWCDDARSCRSAYRSCFTPGRRGTFLGFRLVRTRKT